jgi:hypothetical protein
MKSGWFYSISGFHSGLGFLRCWWQRGVANGRVPYGFRLRDFLKGHFIKGLSSAVPPSYPFFVLLFSSVTLHGEITGRVSGTLWADE